MISQTITHKIARILVRFHHPAGWLGFAFLALVLDYLSGPIILFPITFVFPIAFAAWHRGGRWSMPLAVLLPSIRMIMSLTWELPWPPLVSAVNMVIDMVILSAFAFLVERVSLRHHELEKELDVLRGLLPVCSFCKKIRDEHNQWHPMETYISARSKASFSHGLCSECAQKHYPEYFKNKSNP